MSTKTFVYRGLSIEAEPCLPHVVLQGKHPGIPPYNAVAVVDAHFEKILECLPVESAKNPGVLLYLITNPQEEFLVVGHSRDTRENWTDVTLVNILEYQTVLPREPAPKWPKGLAKLGDASIVQEYVQLLPVDAMDAKVRELLDVEYPNRPGTLDFSEFPVANLCTMLNNDLLCFTVPNPPPELPFWTPDPSPAPSVTTPVPKLENFYQHLKLRRDQLSHIPTHSERHLPDAEFARAFDAFFANRSEEEWLLVMSVMIDGMDKIKYRQAQAYVNRLLLSSDVDLTTDMFQ